MGFHTNFCLAGPPAGTANPLEGVPQAEIARQRAVAGFMENERGYLQEQSTKPQTVGYGLDDSPVGLAAWIVEKFKTWSDSDGNVEKRFTKDELLTNVMLYWVTQSGAASARIYYENARAGGTALKVEVPTACAVFPKELNFAPRRWVEATHNLTRWTEMPPAAARLALDNLEVLNIPASHGISRHTRRG